MLDCAIDYVLSSRDIGFRDEHETYSASHRDDDQAMFERRLREGEPSANATYHAVSDVLAELSAIVTPIIPPPFVKNRILSAINGAALQPSFNRVRGSEYGN